MADIFISYARPDQPRIERLAAALEDAGYSVWWDRHIKGGSEYSRDIESAIKDARAVIVVWSAASANSEWVREEASYARDHGKLVPVSIDDTPPPFGYRQRQSIDLNDTNAEPQLHAALDALIDGEHGEIDTAAPTGRKLSPMLLAIPLLLLVAAAGWYFLSDRFDADTQTALEDRRGVMVLPFLAQSSGEDDQYFADGLTEEILNRLDALEELRVVPRTTAFNYRETDQPINVIADEVSVGHVVEGTLRRDGDRVRVTARLVEAAGEQTLWSEDYDATVEDVFKVQADIAEKVASSLDVLLDRRKRTAMQGAGIDNPEAFALYAKGNDYYARGHEALPDLSIFAKAIPYYDRALAMAPNFAQAQISAADFYSHIVLDEAGGVFHDELPREMREGALDQLRSRLMAARGAEPDADDRLGINLTLAAFSDDWSDIPSMSERFYTMEGNCAGLAWPGFGYSAYGNADKVFAQYRRRLDCGANSPGLWRYLSWSALMSGKLSDLEELLASPVAHRAPQPSLEFAEIVVAIGKGRRQQAVALAEQAENPEARTFVALALGNRDKLPSIEEISEASPFNAVRMLSVSGYQKEADDWAARIDAAPAGPSVLQIIVDECGCGAPFDISRTPNFRARLDELGAKWPPKSPINWPLKKEPGP